MTKRNNPHSPHIVARFFKMPVINTITIYELRWFPGWFYYRMNEPSYIFHSLFSFILPIFASLSFEERNQDKTTVPTFRRRVNSTIVYGIYRLECFVFFYSSATNNSHEQWAHETKICVKCKAIGSKFPKSKLIPETCE